MLTTGDGRGHDERQPRAPCDDRLSRSSRRAALLFVIPLATAFVAYRAYISQRQTERRPGDALPIDADPAAEPGAGQRARSRCSSTRARCSGPTSQRSRCCRRARSGPICCGPPPGPARGRRLMRPIGAEFDDPLLQRACRRANARAIHARSSGARAAGKDDGRPVASGTRWSPRSSASRGLVGTLVVADRLSDISTFDHGRPEALRDARQPHRRRPRERPAGAVAGRAVAAQGGAPPPGLPRLADRPRQPRAVQPSRSTRARGRRPAAGRRRAVPRPRRLQDRQRHASATPPATSCSSAVARADPRLHPDRRPRGAARRRRVRDPARGRARTSTASLAVAGAPQRCVRGAVRRRRARPSTSARASASRPARRRHATADDLLRNADVAMYSAKARGKDRFAVFEPTMHAAVVATRHELTAALAARRRPPASSSLHYQPIVDLADGHDRRASRRSCAGSTRRAASSGRSSSSRSPRSRG